MPIPLDDKQFRLVRAWMGYAATDAYGSFISLWVAFNALCSAKYASAANQPRADLDRKKSSGLAAVTATPVAISGTASRDGDRIKLVLDAPGRMTIKIAEKYTEDIIFDRFAEDFQGEYERWLADEGFRLAVESLRAAIVRPDGHHYLFNMAKTKRHPLDRPYTELKAVGGLIVAWEDPTRLNHLKSVLYQVRNNIFHGEKVPGEVNDDRIVKAATPVLAFICKQLVPEIASELDRGSK